MVFNQCISDISYAIKYENADNIALTVQHKYLEYTQDILTIEVGLFHLNNQKVNYELILIWFRTLMFKKHFETVVQEKALGIIFSDGSEVLVREHRRIHNS